MYEWDEAKRRANLAKHGVDFAEVLRFDWAGAIVEPDRRRDYGEDRLSATGCLDGRLCMVVFTRRAGRVRIISLRKVNKREIARWTARHESER